MLRPVPVVSEKVDGAKLGREMDESGAFWNYDPGLLADDNRAVP